MSRSLTSLAIESMNVAHTNNAYLFLLEITESSLPATLYFVNNNEDITSNGQVYTKFPFRLTLPDDPETGTPQVTLSIDNVDRQISDALLSMTSFASVTLKVIVSSAPDDIVLQIDDFILRSFQGDAFEISAKLSLEDIMAQAYPKDTYNATEYPALFKYA